MKNQTWGWVVGGAVFAMVAGIWVWQLPNIIDHATNGKSSEVPGIMSVLGGVRRSVAPDLLKTQAVLDANLKKMNDAIKAQEAKAAAIEDLKNKIGKKNNVEAATVPTVQK